MIVRQALALRDMSPTDLLQIAGEWCPAHVAVASITVEVISTVLSRLAKKAAGDVGGEGGAPAGILASAGGEGEGKVDAWALRLEEFVAADEVLL